MKKPIAPTKPKAPKEPVREYCETIPWSFPLAGTLQDLMNEIARAAEFVWEPINGVGRHSAGRVCYANVRIETDYDGGCDAKWNQSTIVTLTDTAFARAQAKYQENLTKYRAKLNEYEKRMIQYESDLKAYLKEQRNRTEIRERKMLAD